MKVHFVLFLVLGRKDMFSCHSGSNVIKGRGDRVILITSESFFLDQLLKLWMKDLKQDFSNISRNP